MSVGAVDRQTSAWASQESGVDSVQNRAVLLKDDFLKLLVAQLQNQDPLDPASNQEFAAQLAQFSSLEQLQQMNKSLENQLKSNSQLGLSIINSTAASFIGKDIRAVGSQFTLSSDEDATIHFTQASASASTKVKIYNSSGSGVRVLNLGEQPAGDLEVVWNGKNLNGDRLPDGVYQYEIESLNYDGQVINTVSFMTGSVKGVRYAGGEASLLLDNDYEIPLENVYDVLERSGSE